MPPRTKLRTEGLHVHYGAFHALKNVSVTIGERRLTALIGPSGCGKSTLLRVFNRMNDLVAGCRVEGKVELDGRPVYEGSVDIEALRRRVGMVFQKPNPFPSMSVRDNVLSGLRLTGGLSAVRPDEIVEKALRDAALWEEVKDRLDKPGVGLSGGQQQRLCIARSLAVSPEVLLMDEPCSALDPIATSRIEDLIHSLKETYTIAIVTHNMQQAARVSDYTAFLLGGDLVEFSETNRLFTSPRDSRTEDYITGKFG